MSFAAPLLLAGLVLVPLALVLYVLVQRRRRRYAVRYTNLAVLAGVVGRRSWVRHVPALLGLLALACLLLAVARPERAVTAERREATVMLVSDTSGSMLATDVKPSRLAAAKAAGTDFVSKMPDDFRVGLVGFGTTAQQYVEPTTQHERVIQAIRALKVAGTTAMGEGLNLGLRSASAPIPDGFGATRRLPAAIVLLSDGANQRGRDPETVAAAAKKLRIPIYTVALGTQAGTYTHNGSTEKVPPDTLVLQDIAKQTGGRYFAAADVDRLEAVYQSIGTRLTRVKEKQEISSAFAGGALALVLAGAAFSLVRAGRLP